LAAGTYTVTVSDANGCFNTANVTVFDPNGISLTAAVTSNYNGAQISCFGLSNGTAAATASGGTGILTYLWSNAQTSIVATGLSASNYTVTVTDINGCFRTANITVTQPTAVSVSIAVDTFSTGTQISCNGVNDAEATATASGGTGTLTYTWSAGNAINNNTAFTTIAGNNATSYSPPQQNTAVTRRYQQAGCLRKNRSPLGDRGLQHLTIRLGTERLDIALVGAKSQDHQVIRRLRPPWRH
jgi:hypothetical protein